LFIPESPVGSEDSAQNASSSSNYDKPLTKEDKTNNGNKSYVSVYRCGGWEERLNGYTSAGHNHASSAEQNFREEKTNAGYPNPNFQRQDWLRAQLKRTSRTNKADEHEPRKERFGDKDIYDREYLRQQDMKENVENCKTYRSRQLNVNYDALSEDYDSKSSQQDIRGNERVSIHDSEQDLTGGGDTPRSNGSDCYDFKKKDGYGEYQKEKEAYNEYKKVSCTGCQYPSVTREIPEQKSTRYLAHHQKMCDEYERVKHIYMEVFNYCKNEESKRKSEYERSDANDSYKGGGGGGGGGGSGSAVVDLNEDEQTEKTSWPDTPPPLPPRLRHLPPVHMNLEDRHKVAGRSRSLPPPPPYRPPPQPRAPITTRHLGYGRSVVDDESYV